MRYPVVDVAAAVQSCRARHDFTHAAERWRKPSGIGIWEAVGCSWAYSRYSSAGSWLRAVKSTLVTIDNVNFFGSTPLSSEL